MLKGFALVDAELLLERVREIAAISPFRHMVTPGGFRMSVGLTNCGRLGWVTDRSGYRYDTVDPATGQAWPSMPSVFEHLARNAAGEAGFANFTPDACLVNRYEPEARLTLHQDK